MCTKARDARNADLVVLIPHYNNLQGLRNSLASISTSTFKPNVLVVDDGSPFAIDVQDLRSVYPYTELLLSDRNMGIVHAMNKGLKHIQRNTEYSFIARLDCDDLCHPKRFSVQRAFLLNHPDISLVGSWVTFTDEDGKPLWTYKTPTKHEALRRRMYCNNVFIHPSTMFRLNILEKIGFYPTQYAAAEDYAFFFNVISECQTANIPQVLTECKITQTGISTVHRVSQLKSRIRIILQHFELTPSCIYGIVRTCLLCLFPLNITVWLKSKLLKIVSSDPK